MKCIPKYLWVCFAFAAVLLATALLLWALKTPGTPSVDTGTEAESSTESNHEAESDTQSGSNTESGTERETEPEAPAKTKRVAFTFDDGPSRQGLTEKIVDEFAKYGGKATFFMLGNLISDATGDSLAYASSRGFEIGIHGYTHEIYFDTCGESEFLSEVSKTSALIAGYTGIVPTLLRAPGGRIPAERSRLAGLPVINWSVDTEDWRYKSMADDVADANVATIVGNALDSIGDGDIVLMHEIYTNSFTALCQILAALDAEGYEFVTVTDLIGKENLTPGKTYYDRTTAR